MVKVAHEAMSFYRGARVEETGGWVVSYRAR